jgi:hypothetical protein
MAADEFEASALLPLKRSQTAKLTLQETQMSSTRIHQLLVRPYRGSTDKVVVPRADQARVAAAGHFQRKCR